MEYSQKEERVNAYTHALGIAMSIIASFFLISKAFESENIWKQVSYLVFLGTMLFTYTMSTSYHLQKPGNKKKKLRILDHIAIFMLISGTYTPFLLVPLRETGGWAMFITVWSITIAGTFFKIFFTGRYKLLSNLLYLGMGWIIVFAGRSLFDLINDTSLFWLVVGGVSYSVGVIFYSLKKLSYSHGIFHMFVLGGSLSHVISIYWL